MTSDVMIHFCDLKVQKSRKLGFLSWSFQALRGKLWHRHWFYQSLGRAKYWFHGVVGMPSSSLCTLLSPTFVHSLDWNVQSSLSFFFETTAHFLLAFTGAKNFGKPSSWCFRFLFQHLNLVSWKHDFKWTSTLDSEVHQVSRVPPGNLSRQVCSLSWRTRTSSLRTCEWSVSQIEIFEYAKWTSRWMLSKRIKQVFESSTVEEEHCRSQDFPLSRSGIFCKSNEGCLQWHMLPVFPRAHVGVLPV